MLLASLEQLAEEHDIAPLSPPEHRSRPRSRSPTRGRSSTNSRSRFGPTFDLPNYKGLKLRRPIHTFTEEDVAREERRLLAPLRPVVPKPEGERRGRRLPHRRHGHRAGDRVLSTIEGSHAVAIDDALAFKDGVARKFGDQVQGAKAGDTRRGGHRTVRRARRILAAGADGQGDASPSRTSRRCVCPKLTHEFLHKFGVHSAEQFHEISTCCLNGVWSTSSGKWPGSRCWHQIAAATLGIARRTC